MKFIRKHKIISTSILLILITVFIVGVVYAKYIYNIINNYILESKKFYFNSSTLSINNKQYQINNWDGVSSYFVTVDVSNKKTDERYTKSDIEYDISVECDDTKLTCITSKLSGTIRENTHTDSYQVTITPIASFSAGQSISFKTIATSTYPYEKELSATYTLNVVNSMFTYNIDDNAGDLALNLNLTNSMAYYEVEQAFGTYSVGNTISQEVYETLSDTDKAKCFSAKVTLTFDPSVVIVDSTDESITNRLSTGYQETTINGNNYISQYTFKVDAATNKKIIFYKNNPSLNYTYPITNVNSMVTVSVVLARD